MKRVSWMFAALAVLIVVAGAAWARDSVVGPYRGTLAVKEYEWRLKSLGLKPEELCVHSIGQSHIDAAWKWRLKQTHDKVFDTWSQAIRHMDNYPEFTFSGSTPQYYEWIEQDHPELFVKIVEREREGRWEIVGGQWVEPDGNMPDGESFVRQRLIGQRYYLERFGKISTVGWMLDSFGYNWNYPQIMAKSGAKYMWTSKLTWNDTTIFPFHNFHWRSPDGSQVITHICPITTPFYFPYGELEKFKQTRYLVKPGVELIADYTTSQETIDAALSEDWLGEIGVFYGLGDGGLGPRKFEVETQREFANKGYAKFSTSLALFEDIAKCADRLPVWLDEMYLEYHRGVLTTQAWLKRANREAEQMLRSAESLRSVLSVFGVRYPYQELKEVWKVLLLNHFHDILPGSSIPEVYDDAKLDFARIKAAAHEITYGGMDGLAMLIKMDPPDGDSDAAVVFNPLPWTRSSLVRLEVPSSRPYQVVDKSGAEVAYQAIQEDGKNFLHFMARDLPSVGHRVYYLKQAAAMDEAPVGSSPAVTETGDAITLENEFVAVKIDKQSGLITSLLDKVSGKEVIGRPSNKLLVFYDHDTVYSAWNIMADYRDHPIALDPGTQVSVSAQGPLYAEVLVHNRAQFRNKWATFDQRVRLMAGDPVVRLDLDSDMHMDYVIVKVEFNTVFHGENIAAENAYLTVERPTHPATAAEKAAWEMPCQKWIDISEAGMGLALLNNGKYGFSLNEDGTGYRLSVIKAAHHPKANFEAKEVKYHYYNPLPTLPTDQGAHHVEMGLLVHQGDWREAMLWRAGYNFNTPVEAAWATPNKRGKLPEEASFLSVDNGQVLVGSLKRAEDDDDLVIRLVEMTGAPATVTVSLGEGMSIVSAAETDLLEMDPQPLTASGSSFTVDLTPYEIKTVKMTVVKGR